MCGCEWPLLGRPPLRRRGREWLIRIGLTRSTEGGGMTAVSELGAVQAGPGESPGWVTAALPGPVAVAASAPTPDGSCADPKIETRRIERRNTVSAPLIRRVLASRLKAPATTVQTVSLAETGCRRGGR